MAINVPSSLLLMVNQPTIMGILTNRRGGTHNLIGGIPTPLKNMKVSWDYYSQYMETHINVPNHQPDKFVLNTGQIS